MGRQVVEKQANLLSLGGRPQLGQPLDKLVHVDRLRENAKMIDALLFRDPTKQGQGRLVELRLVDCHVFFLPGPFSRVYSGTGNHSFISIDKSVPVIVIPS